MQEKEQKISPIKQRILLFSDSLGISKRKFYTKIGVSRGTLEAKSGITEDIVAKFIATYPEVSPEWLLTGNGPMLRTNSTENQSLPAPVNNQPPDANTANTVPENNDKIIRELLDRLERLIGENTLLRKENEELKNKDCRPDGITSHIHEWQKVST